MDPFSGVHCFLSAMNPYLLLQSRQPERHLKALPQSLEPKSCSISLPHQFLTARELPSHASSMESDPSSSNGNSDTALSSLFSSMELAERNVPISRAQRRDLDRHMSFLPDPAAHGRLGSSAGRDEEVLMTPIFSGPVLRLDPAKFPQYGLLGQNLSRPLHRDNNDDDKPVDPRILVNVSTPWSAFICGSQGKSTISSQT